MKIEFDCATNKEFVAINTLHLRLPSGTVLTLDRDSTEWTIDNGNLSMVWNGVYLWEIDGYCIFCDDTGHGMYVSEESFDEFLKYVESAVPEFDLDDDVDPDYRVDIKSYRIFL